RIEKGVRERGESVSSTLVTECDVRSDDDVERVVRESGEALGGLDLLVHSGAFAPAGDLRGGFTGPPPDPFSAASTCSCTRSRSPLRRISRGGSRTRPATASGRLSTSARTRSWRPLAPR